jgi:3-methyladenine DNA glycosylase/8-oxoguanine DNA glycosylase
LSVIYKLLTNKKIVVMGLKHEELGRVTSFEMEALAPYEFELTVRKPLGYHWLTPYEVYHEKTIWTAMELGSGKPVGLRLKSIGPVDYQKIRGSVFSDEKLGQEEERTLFKSVARCLELNTDINDFYLMAEHDPILSQVKTDLYGMRCGRHQRLFQDIVRAITMQWASLERTKQMSKLLFEAYGRRISFDGHTISAWFTPTQIARASLRHLREKCKLGFRAKYLKAIADLIHRKDFPCVERLEGMPAEDAKRELMKLKGIGEYSAEIALTHTERFPIDQWSVKVFWSLFFPDRAIPPLKIAMREVRACAEEIWKRWRGYAFVYVINDLDNLSKRFSVKLT